MVYFFLGERVLWTPGLSISRVNTTNGPGAQRQLGFLEVLRLTRSSTPQPQSLSLFEEFPVAI
jgi:hypothetical protein